MCVKCHLCEQRRWEAITVFCLSGAVLVWLGGLWGCGSTEGLFFCCVAFQLANLGWCIRELRCDIRSHQAVKSCLYAGSSANSPTLQVTGRTFFFSMANTTALKIIPASHWSSLGQISVMKGFGGVQYRRELYKQEVGKLCFCRPTAVCQMWMAARLFLSIPGQTFSCSATLEPQGKRIKQLNPNK